MRDSSWLSALLEGSLKEEFKLNNLRNKENWSLINEYQKMLDRWILSYQSNVAGKVDEDISDFLVLSTQVEQKLRKCIESENKLLLLQVIQSNVLLVKWIKDRPGIQNTNQITEHIEFHKLRDVGLANNLRWLLTTRYSTSKVIVLESTYHLSKNINGIYSMASYLNDKERSESVFYTLIYSDANGLHELENLADGEKYFLSFQNNLLKNSIDEINYEFSRALPQVAKWSEVYDGVFYVGKYRPAQRKKINVDEIIYFKNRIFKAE